jgi:hypothetical protein
MKKRYTEEQIIGFLREADAGLPFNEGINQALPMLKVGDEFEVPILEGGGLALRRVARDAA